MEIERVFVDEVYYLDNRPMIERGLWPSYSNYEGRSCAVLPRSLGEMAPDWMIETREVPAAMIDAALK